MNAALITGGTSGIGRATAELLHERGYHVAVTGQSAQSVERPRAELPDGVLVLKADSRSLVDTDRVVDEVRTRFGRLTLVFLNAGITRPAPIGDVDEATFDELFDVNTKGQFFTLQKALPLLAMVPSLALELAPRRIRVNAVSPGAIETPIWSRRGGSAEQVSAMLHAVARTNPFGRLGTAREIAETVAFLASDGAAYVTGQNIVVGGGAGLSA